MSMPTSPASTTGQSPTLTRTTTTTVTLYRCTASGCNATACQHGAIAALHGMIEHGYSSKRPLVKCESSAQKYHLPPGRWNQLRGGLYGETIAFLAKRIVEEYRHLRKAAAKSLFEALGECERRFVEDIIQHNASPLVCVVRQVSTREIIRDTASKLNCLNDSQFRSILRSDEEKIVEILRDIIDNDKESILALRDGEAVDFLDIIDTIIRDDVVNGTIRFQGLKPISLGTRKKLYRIAVRLSQASQQFTRRIHLSNVLVPPTSTVAFGSFGVVYKAQYQNKHIAFKLLHDQSGQASHSDGKRYPKAFCKEAVILRYLKHPNVCSLIGIAEFVLDNSSKVGLVTPWMSKGNVMTFTANLKGGWQQVVVINFMYEIITGLQYLHNMEVVHADLHPGNILVDETEHVQLVDFGMANFSNSTQSTAGSIAPGALCYMAPEVIALWESDATHLPSRHTEESDIYSFGQVCWHLYTGLRPPHVTRIIRGEHPKRSESTRSIPDPVWDCMLACWSQEPDQRPNAARVGRMLDDHVGRRQTRVQSQLILDDVHERPDPESDAPTSSAGSITGTYVEGSSVSAIWTEEYAEQDLINNSHSTAPEDQATVHFTKHQAWPYKIKEGAEAEEETVRVMEMGAELRRMKTFIGYVSEDTMDWVRSITAMMKDMQKWSEGFALVLNERDPIAEAWEAFSDVVQTSIVLCTMFEEKLQLEFVPRLKQLSDSTNKPRRLLETMRVLEPMQLFNFTKSRPSKALIRAQLYAELPTYLALLDRGVQACLNMFQRLQRMLYQRINENWSELWEALKVDEGECGTGAQIVAQWHGRFEEVILAIDNLRIVRPFDERFFNTPIRMWSPSA